VTFRPGDPDEMTVELTVRDDNILERDEIFFINLQLASTDTGGQLGARNSAVGTVINDDSKLYRETKVITVLSFQYNRWRGELCSTGKACR